MNGRYDISKLNDAQRKALTFAYQRGYCIAQANRADRVPSWQTRQALVRRGLMTLHTWGIHILTGPGAIAAEDIIVEQMQRRQVQP